LQGAGHSKAAFNVVRVDEWHGSEVEVLVLWLIWHGEAFASDHKVYLSLQPPVLPLRHTWVVDSIL